MMFFRIAILYMRKHLRRTLVIVAAVAISVAVMVFVEGFLTGLRDSFFQGLFQDSGHLQIHGTGYSDRLDPYTLDYRIENPETVLRRLGEDERVIVADQLLPFGGLLIHQQKNIPTGGVGLRPDSEFYANVRRGMIDGGMPDKTGEIAVSRDTAELLGIEYDGTAILLVQDTTGSPYYSELAVSGIFQTDSSEFDTSHVFVTHEEASQLLYLEESTIEVRALLGDPDRAAEVKSSLAPFLTERGLEASTWKDVHGSFVVAFELFDVFVIFIDVILVVVAATVITNAILMNIFERSTEFGTLRAIGMKRRQQAGMIFAEGSLEGALGSVLGLLIGVPAVLYLQANGVSIGEFSESFGLGRVVHPRLMGWNVLRSFVAGVAIALAGSAYVTIVSSRTRIMQLLGQA